MGKFVNMKITIFCMKKSELRGEAITMPETKPLNDAVAHMQNIEGAPTSIEIKKLPRLLRYFGYFMAGFFGLSLLMILIGIVIQ